MKRFENILCYVGGETPQPGIHEAARLAEGNGAKLTLIDVLPESTEGPWLTLPSKPNLEQLVVAARVADLEEMAAPLEARGLAVRIFLATGSAFVEIIRRTIEKEHDLVVKTAEGERSHFGLLGTTALHLMRKCPAPVWAVKPSEPKLNRILAAVDPDPQNPNALDLNARILQLAASLAQTRESELQIVHAWWLFSEAALRGPRIGLPPDEVENLLAGTRAAAQGALDNLMAEVDLGDVPYQADIVQGLPVDVLTSLSEESDVLVMGTISRSGIEGVLIGNTAESVLRRIDCSALVVKPSGFETPLHF